MSAHGVKFQMDEKSAAQENIAHFTNNAYAEKQHKLEKGMTSNFGAAHHSMGKKIGTMVKEETDPDRMVCTNMDTRVDIMVMGVCNKDMIAYLPRFPKAGETMQGHEYEEGFGGKGANQAVMAARVAADTGISVGLISKLGEDDIGGDTRVNFKEQGVSTDFIFSTDKAYSGAAMIWVNMEDGSNQIVITGGTNEWLSEEEIWRSGPSINASTCFLCQLELPLSKNKVALQVAKNYGRTLQSDIHGNENYYQKQMPVTILNTAPAPPDAAAILPLLEFVDIVCPNEVELQMLSHGLPTGTMKEAAYACRTLMHMDTNPNMEKWIIEAAQQKNNVRYVICTLGQRGAIIVGRDEEGYEWVRCEQVNPVDTTGAGDCFLGSFSFVLTQALLKMRQEDPEGAWTFDEKLSVPLLKECAEFGVRAATISVLEKGSQCSFPNQGDIERGIDFS